MALSHILALFSFHYKTAKTKSATNFEATVDKSIRLAPNDVTSKVLGEIVTYFFSLEGRSLNICVHQEVVEVRRYPTVVLDSHDVLLRLRGDNLHLGWEILCMRD